MTRLRVVCGRSDTMEILSPTSALSSVLLPAFAARPGTFPRPGASSVLPILPAPVIVPGAIPAPVP
jgi:hypothetical protein